MSQLILFEHNEQAGAKFSEDKKQRYLLWRIWDNSKDRIMFIGLNPSTANEKINDATIRRVINFSKLWGYGGVYMLNLYTKVTTYPENLINIDNKSILIADTFIDTYSKICDKIVFAWGSFDIAKLRGKQITNKYKGYALKINNNGSPGHPLYIKNSTQLIKYN